jgi:hypothetical protein
MDRGDEVVDRLTVFEQAGGGGRGSPASHLRVEWRDESVAPARPGCALLDRAVDEELIDK